MVLRAGQNVCQYLSWLGLELDYGKILGRFSLCKFRVNGLGCLDDFVAAQGVG